MFPLSLLWRFLVCREGRVRGLAARAPSVLVVKTRQSPSLSLFGNLRAGLRTNTLNARQLAALQTLGFSCFPRSQILGESEPLELVYN